MIPISLERVSFRYSSGGRAGARDVLDGVTLQVPEGAMLGLIGPNGSGKSTLLRCIFRALRPQAGRVLLIDRDVQRYGASRLAREVAVAVQQEEGSVPLTTMEYVLLGRSTVTPAWKSYSSDDRSRAEEAIREFGLEEMKDQPVLQLSGGERKRALLARTLVQGTNILLLDEPTNHLDVRFQHQVLQLVGSLNKTAVVVLHDLNLAARYCQHLALIDHGRLVAAGTAEDVLKPELLEPVYGLEVHRIEIRGKQQFLMSPRE